MPAPRGVFIAFSASQLDPEAFSVLRVRGSESLSKPYEFVLEVGSSDPDLDGSQVIGHPATLEIRREGDTARIHGIVESFEYLEFGREWKQYQYRAVLVPRISMLGLGRQCRVFLDKDVPAIVKEVLEGYGLSSGEDFSITTGSHPKREYVVQYNESDLAFIQRLMEHEGIFYFFEQGEEREKLIVADDKSIHTEIGAPDPQVAYREPRGMEPGGEAVTAFTMRQRLLPSEVVLKDYNYRTPTRDLKSAAPVETSGRGVVMEYGNHFKEQAEGDDLAEVRAQEIRCNQKVFEGRSSCRHFRSGYKFTLSDHYRPSFDGEYLLTSVRHFGEQPAGLGSAAAAAGAEATAYYNEFTAIPADVQYRPPRTTPKPRLHGVINAVVDAGGSGQYAEIDDMGRYKVKLPFDLSDAKEGKASRFIRMAQPYAGAEYGMHFPLHKGTEVLLTHVDGDLDRPIIQAAVPNPKTASPVTGPNQTQARIRTASDNELVMEDTEGKEYILIRTPAETTHLSLGADHHSDHAPPGITMGSKFGVSINAGKGVTISAGSPNHDEGMSTQGSKGGEVAGVAATVAATTALVGGIAADTFASGIAKAAPALLGDLGGFAAGISLPGVYVTAPGKAAVTAGGEVVIGALGSADVVALGPANILSVAGAMVGSVKGSAVVSAGKVEVISGLSDVFIEAKKLGDVIVEAKKNVKIEAHTGNIQIEAQKKNIGMEAEINLLMKARKGWGRLATKKEITLVSEDTKKIELKAGKSSIVLEDNKITMKGDSIILQSNDGNASIVLGKEGKPSPFMAHSKKTMHVTSEDTCTVASDKQVYVWGKKDVKVESPKLDMKKVGKEDHKQYVES